MPFTLDCHPQVDLPADRLGKQPVLRYLTPIVVGAARGPSTFGGPGLSETPY